jgi:hypothetical protein
MIKTLNKISRKITHLKTIKVIYEKSTENIVITGGKISLSDTIQGKDSH